VHLTLEQYLLALRGETRWHSLVEQAHARLVEVCPACRERWDGEPLFAAPAEAPEAMSPPPSHGALPASRTFFLATYDRELDRLQRMRAIARCARQDLSRLLRLPEEEWSSIVTKATTRFCSLAFVHLLIEKARTLVRAAPERSAALAALVPLALDRVPGRDAMAWARELRLRGAAHHANAFRVTGDLPAAQRIFAELRRTMAGWPPCRSALIAEIASLEATLRTAQRRFVEADHLLAEAAEAYRQASDSLGLARTAIQQANLSWTRGDAEQTLLYMEAAAATLSERSESDVDLLLCTVTGRVLALCELGRFTQARKLLARHRRDYQAPGAGHALATALGLEGRIALGLGDYQAAERSYTAGRDAVLALGRFHDAALASLDLAGVLLAAGKTAELRQLAIDLVPLFASHGVEREMLASLRLLAEAARAETVTTGLLAKLRRGLETGSSVTEAAFVER